MMLDSITGCMSYAFTAKANQICENQGGRFHDVPASEG